MKRRIYFTFLFLIVLSSCGEEEVTPDIEIPLEELQFFGDTDFVKLPFERSENLDNHAQGIIWVMQSLQRMLENATTEYFLTDQDHQPIDTLVWLGDSLNQNHVEAKSFRIALDDTWSSVYQVGRDADREYFWHLSPFFAGGWGTINSGWQLKDHSQGWLEYDNLGYANRFSWTKTSENVTFNLSGYDLFGHTVILNRHELSGAVTFDCAGCNPSTVETVQWNADASGSWQIYDYDEERITDSGNW